MVLSNAERQARFQKRLREKAAAAKADLGERAREAMDDGIATLWAIIRRPSADGRMHSESDEFATLDVYRIHWAEQLRGGENAARWFDAYVDDATADEKPILERAMAVANAVRLSHVNIPDKPKTRKRGK